MVHTLADVFRIQDYTDNWQLLDDFPGIFICTSGTRPTWGVNQEGMLIYETDSNLFWTWGGAAWERWIGKGHLGGVEVTSNVVTSSTTYVVAITTPVTTLAGARRHLITVHAPGIFNTNGVAELALYRDATLLQEWQQPTPGTYPWPISMTVPDTPSVAAVDYTLQVRSNGTAGGATTISATATKPLALDVFEM